MHEKSKAVSREASKRRARIATVVIVFLFLVGAVFYLRTSGQLDPQKQAALAASYAERGEVRRAIIEYKNILQDDPQNVEARLALGELFLGVKDGVSAYQELDKLKRQGVATGNVDTLLLRALLLQGQFSQVLGELISPPETMAEVDLALLRGEAQLGLGNNEAAQKSFEEALRLDPSSQEARRFLAQVALVSGDPTVAKSHIDELLGDEASDVEALVVQGELDYLNRDLAASRKTFEQALGISDEHLLARYGLTRTLLAMGEAQAALPHIEYLIEANPNRPAGYFFKAVAHRQLNEVNLTRDALNEVLRIAPDHPASLLMSGVLNTEQGNHNQAEQQLERYVELTPGNPRGVKLLGTLYINGGKFQESIRLLDDYSQQQNPDAEILALLGTAHMALGDHQRATEYLRQASSLRAESAKVRAQLALSYLSASETEQAIVELESALVLDPQYQLAEYLLMFSHLQAAQYDAALEVGAQLASASPGNPVPPNLIGRVYEMQGNLQAARDSYQHAIDVDSAYVPASLNLARLMMQDDVAQAKRQYESALAVQPDNATALQALAAIAKRQGRGDESLKYLAAAVDADENALRSRIILATEYLARGDFTSAAPVLDEAHAIAPQHPQVATLYAQMHMAKGEFAKAIEGLSTIIEKYPNVADTYYLLGKAYARSADYESASRSWEQTIEL